MITTQGLPCVINAFASDHWMFGPVLCRVYGCLGGIFGKATEIGILACENLYLYRNGLFNDNGGAWLRSLQRHR